MNWQLLVCSGSIATNGRSFALIGFCKRLVCANLRKGCVSSLVIFFFLRWGAVDFITLIINKLLNN